MKVRSYVQRNFLIIVMVIAVSALTALNLRLWNAEIVTSPIKPLATNVSGTKNSVEGGVNFQPAKLSDFLEISRRPIFSISRRQPVKKKAVLPKALVKRAVVPPKPIPIVPPKPAPVASPKPAPVASPKPIRSPIEQIKLIGVLKYGNIWKALVETPNTQNGVWLTQNISFEGWKIVKIDGHRVTLRGGSNAKELYLYKLTNTPKN